MGAGLGRLSDPRLFSRQRTAGPPAAEDEEAAASDRGLGVVEQGTGGASRSFEGGGGSARGMVQADICFFLSFFNFLVLSFSDIFGG